MQMLDGFNGGWINFEGGETGPRKGKSQLRIVLIGLVERAAPAATPLAAQ